MDATMTMGGKVGARVFRGSVEAPLSWRLRNSLRPGYIWGSLATGMAHLFTRVTKLPVVVSELRAVKNHRDGCREDFGVVCRRVVTDAGVAFLVDALQGSVEPEILKYHGVGTGTTAEAADQTALVTEITTQTTPDSTRATGSLAEGATANIFKTVATTAFDGAAAVTEHGLFSQAATGGGVMFDRSKFDAINVVSGDSIEFSYSCTLTSGG